MARTKGWLTEHDLRSGLREQVATETKVVELYWDKGLNHFVVTTQYPQTHPGQVFGSVYRSLARAREFFDACVRRDRQSKKGASR